MKKPCELFNRIAAALAALTAVVHLFVGGIDTLAPTLEAGLPPSVSGTMHACWHIVSVVLIASTLIFLQGGRTAFVFALLWISFAAIFVYVGLYHGGIGGLIVNPQWTILLLTGAFGLLGTRSFRSEQKHATNGA